MSQNVPRRLGSYRIIAKLGAGGMANVYLGMHGGMAQFRKLVVVKVLHPDVRANPEFLAMFLAEARLAARLNHPNVVTTYEVGEDAGRHYMAMEYLEGQAFNAIVKKYTLENVPIEHTLRVLIDVLSGLHYAHELRDFDGSDLGIVHRDVNPQNIFVTYDGNVKLVDFGIAKAACSELETGAGTIKGKIAYLSPEQASGQKVDRRADIFAIGVLLWEALAGRRFSATSLEVATIHKRVTGGEARIREVMPDAPGDLADICDKAIALEPVDRFASALEMKIALEAAQERRREPSNSRSLSLFVSEAFSEERSAIRTVIEEHARIALSEPPPDTTGSNPIPVINPRDGSAELSSPTGSIGTHAATTGTIVAQPSRSSSLPWIAAVAVVGIAGASVVYVAGGRDTAPTATESPTVQSPAAKSTAEPESDKIELLVLVSPPEARVSLDGAPLSSNPFHAQVTKGAALHKIRAEAPGYEGQERVVVFDQDVTLKISLETMGDGGEVAATPARGTERSAQKPTEAQPSSTAAASGPPTAGERLTPGRGPARPTRNIDDGDPYAQ